MISELDEIVVLAQEKGELLLHGRRHVAIDMEAFIGYLNSMVGHQIADVMFTSIQYQIGKQDCRRIRLGRLVASPIAIIDDMIRSDLSSGVGIVKVNLPQNGTDPILMELSNPCVKTILGAGRSFDFAYWAGALAVLFGTELDVKDVTYDPESNVKRCRLIAREIALNEKSSSAAGGCST